MTRRIVWLAVIAACSKEPSSNPDASVSIDAAIDAPADAARGTARIHLVGESDDNAGVPIAGARVAVVGRDGVQTTDAQGQATVTVDAGSTVIVVRPAVLNMDDGWIYVVTAVDPGTTIELGARPYTGGTGAATGQLTIHWPLFPGGGITQYGTAGPPCARVGSFFGGTVVYDYVDEGCMTAMRSIRIIAGTGDDPEMAFLMIPDIPNVMTGNTTLNTTATWDTQGTTYSTQLANMGGAAYAQVDVAPASSWMHFGLGFTSITNGTGSSSTRNARYRGPAFAAASIGYASSGARQYVFEPITLGTQYSLDGSTLLPELTSLIFDAATRSFAWTHAAAIVAPSLIRGSFEHDDDNGTRYTWVVYAPGSAASILLPDLPAELTAYDLPSDFVATRPSLVFANVSGQTYRDLLASFDLFDRNGVDPFSYGSARLVMSEWED